MEFQVVAIGGKNLLQNRCRGYPCNEMGYTWTCRKRSKSHRKSIAFLLTMGGSISRFDLTALNTHRFVDSLLGNNG